MAAKQPASAFFFDYRYTTTRLAQLYLTALKACASLSSPLLLVPSSPFTLVSLSDLVC